MKNKCVSFSDLFSIYYYFSSYSIYWIYNNAIIIFTIYYFNLEF